MSRLNSICQDQNGSYFGSSVNRIIANRLSIESYENAVHFLQISKFPSSCDGKNRKKSKIANHDYSSILQNRFSLLWRKEFDVPCSNHSHTIMILKFDSKGQNWSSRACTMHTGKKLQLENVHCLSDWFFVVAIIQNRTASFIVNLSSYPF